MQESTQLIIVLLCKLVAQKPCSIGYSSQRVGIGTSSPQSLVLQFILQVLGLTTKHYNGDTGSGSGDGFLVGVASDEAATIWNLENYKNGFWYK